MTESKVSCKYLIGKHCKQIQNKGNLKTLINYFGVICREWNKRKLGRMLTVSKIR